MRTRPVRTRSTQPVARRRLVAAAVAVTASSAAVLAAAGPSYASAVTAVTAAANPASAGANAQYAITFTTSSALAVGDTITIDEPPGTVAPESSADYTVNCHLLLQTPVSSGPAAAGVASGVAFPDALSGGTYEALSGGPMLLTDPHGLSVATGTYLTGSVGTLRATAIFGGTAAVTTTVQNQIGTALGVG